MRIVVKFGGTSIKNDARLHLAATNLIRLHSDGHEIIAVVSAQGDTTNRLIQKGLKISPSLKNTQKFLNLLSMGEKQSCSLLAMALEEKGQKSHAITQDYPHWPLISVTDFSTSQSIGLTKDNELQHIIMDDDECFSRSHHYIEPILEKGEIPVLAGFFIKDREGNLLSLGRGGSDVTAFLIGKYLKCNEVVIVTDMAGVFSGDPRKVKSARIFDKIDVDTLARFAVTGAQVIHPNALRFKSKDLTAKIVHFHDLDKLPKLGTEIEGTADTKISFSTEKLGLLTFSGQNLHKTKGLLAQISTYLSDKGISIHSITSYDTFVSIYLTEEEAEMTYAEMHEEFIVKRHLFDGLSRIKNVGEIRLSNYIFIESPGIISIISDKLSKEGINIVEMVTAHTDIVIFVNFSIIEKAVSLLKERFGVK